MAAIDNSLFPLDPLITNDTKPFWDACASHRLIFQQCGSCGHIRWPASVICPECSSFDFAWTECKGAGKIYSFVVFRRAFHPSFETRLPYVVASVALDEGPVLLTSIIGCEEEAVACDMRVRAVFVETETGIVLPCFTPTSEQ